MIEIACMREWFSTTLAMIEFRRCLIQALDVKSSQLLQVPHLNEERVELCNTSKHPVTILAEFLDQEPEQRRAILKLEPQEQADVDAFCKHVAGIELKATIEVEDEGEMVVGDVATVTVRMQRKALREDEAIGPVHAPLFPEPKFEEWWIFLVEGGSATTRIIASQRIRDTEKVVVEKLRFQLS